MPNRFVAVLALALAVSCAGAAHALTLFEKEFTCPIGGAKFKGRVVASYTQFGMRLDLKPYGAMLAPIPFQVCPDNGLVMYQQTFTDEEIAKLTPIVLAEDYQRLRKEHTDHYLAAYLRERMGAEDVELGFLYLQASWQAENNPAQLERYRTLALEKIDAFLARDNSHSPRWWNMAIVAAELERLLGHFDAAAARLAKLPVDELPANSPLRKVIDQIRAHAAKGNASPENFVAK